MIKKYFCLIVLLFLFSNNSNAINKNSDYFQSINHKFITFLVDDEESYENSTVNLDSNSELSTRDVLTITSCPGPISVNVTPGTCGAVVTFSLPTTDIPNYSMVLTSALGNGDIFPAGTTLVTYIERDDFNILPDGATCSFNLTVVDNEAPVTPTLSAVTVDCTGTLTAPTTTDVCAGTITGTTSDTLTFVEGGSTNITWTFADGNGNSTTATQVYNYDDTTAPVTPTLAPVTDQCSITLTAPTTTDVCAGTITGTTSTTFPITAQGTTIVTWTYDDGNGNTSTQNQTVILDDVTAPVADVANLPDATGECSVTVTAPTATDNCVGAITGTTTDPLTYNTQGTYTITWTYDDGNGNTSTQNQTVILDDVTAPVANCVAPITITLDAFGNASITTADINNNSSDNCGIFSMSLDKTLFDCSDLGSNTVTLTVRDFANNVSTCTATVTVVDLVGDATVTITSDATNDEICLGDNITFTATPNANTGSIGTTQYYEWFVNGISEGVTTVNTFTPVTPPTADFDIFVRMTTDISVCDPKQSNTINVTVHPLPVVSGPADLCVGNTVQLTPNAGSWASTSGFATVTNTGFVTASTAGIATFTYTNANGCVSDLSITINALPTIGNYPLNNEICDNEVYTSLTPNTGGTWSSSNPAIATITNAGVITGESPGNVTFTFTNTATGCSSTSASIEVLDIPVITSVTVSNDPVCAGDPSTLTANVLGAGNTNETLVNYNFNSGTSYNNSSIVDGNEAAGITSDITGSIGYSRPTTLGTTTNAGAFTQNTTPGGALRQRDDHQDGNNGLGGTPDNGNWRFNINGPNLPNYQDFRVYFQAKRVTGLGGNKRIIVDYRTPNINGGAWVNNYTTLALPAGNTDWADINFPLPPGVNNPNDLDVRLQVNDGSRYDYGNYNCYQQQVCFLWWCWDITVCDDFGAYNIAEPDILIDNLQIQASTASGNFDYAWTADTGANAGLPTGAGTASPTNNQITVNPEVTTNYTVTVTDSNGCPETESVTVNVYPVPTLTIAADYCPSAPNENKVELVATGTGFVSYEWNTGETTQTIYVDTAGTFQVIGTTTDGCTVSVTTNVAQELVIDGDFTNFNAAAPSFVTEYTQNQAFYTGVPTSGLWPEGYYAVNTSANSPSNGVGYHPSFYGEDRTNNSVGARNFLMINGSTTQIDPPGPEGLRQRIIWQQTVTVEPGSDYYFSAYAMNLNPGSPARLQFEVNGVLVGTVADLSTAPMPTSDAEVDLSNWVRFYSNPTWNSTTNTTAVIRIRNLNTTGGGNDFALDDISFASLSTFIKLTSYVGSDNQTVCQNQPIDNITYDVGGGLTPPDIQWSLDGTPITPINTMPDGLTPPTFDGLEYVISGTPTQDGFYEYTITTSSTCDIKSASGTLTVNEAPVVTIQSITSPICYDDGSVAIAAVLSGSATSGTWSGGTGNFTGVSGDGTTATYNFGAGETGTITLTFTSNDPAGPCDAAIETVDIDITPYIVATAGPDQATSNCANTTVNLAANNVTGQWTAVPNTGYFSDATAYNSTFTGESGTTYTLTWTATNAAPCGDTTDIVEITIPDCGDNLIFDGNDDHISFANTDYALDNGSFSIEAWVKPNTVTGTQTIISKRNSNSLSIGYDLSLIGNSLRFRYNNSQIIANQNMTSTKWYHVAVTYNGTNYTMYIDGFVVRAATAGALPASNANRALIGAMDTANNAPVNYFDGGIDEVRIWSTALSQTQIREMMNQEIEANGANVSGVVVPLNISGGLQWNDLIGYYQMKVREAIPVVLSGTIDDISASPTQGRLNRMTNTQAETAPIPYVSVAGTNWDNKTTWSAASVQQIPNSTVDNIVPAQAQTWNIVRTNTDVTANRPATVLNKTVLQGLLVDNNRLSITNNQELNISKYLKIDNGILDLVGESQLLQPLGSIVDYSGTGNGYMERDQQGTASMFNYNYWGSPVAFELNTVPVPIPNPTTFKLQDILYDGNQKVLWTTANDANPSTTPITMSNRWIYAYRNNPENTYADWELMRDYGVFDIGLGFTMKGSGSGNGTQIQNYTFRGQPNNGIITNTVSLGNQTLIGNPYPSAIDAREFIRDNIPGGNPGTSASIDGSLYFWRQSTTNPNHILADYLGGYATLDLSGGVPAAMKPTEIGGIGDAGNVKPEYFVPVAQGFFVTAAAAQGSQDIRFKNSQRFFMRESAGQSIFLEANDENEDITLNSDESNRDDNIEYVDNIQRVRLTFKTPEGAIRYLLLAFTPDNEASDEFDYGYDAENIETLPSDLNWKINDKNYIIQGVGEFDTDKRYPLNMIIGERGNIEIALTELENFDSEIDVFVYDALLGTYTKLNVIDYSKNLDVNTYKNRFFITFKDNQEILDIVEENLDGINVNYLLDSQEIYIRVPQTINVKQVYLINIAGQVVKSWNTLNFPNINNFKIPVRNISEGTYILRLQGDSGTINKKVIINQ